MSGEDLLRDTWLGLRRRLLARGLMPGATDSLSLRDPASGTSGVVDPAAMEAVGIDPRARAETLAPEDWLRLAGAA